MAFEVLQKSPQVAPLLVRLYDTHNLYSLAEDRESQDSCLELTTIMVDLMNIKLSERENELITDVLLALMKKAEKNLKAALAERLSTMDNISLRMVLALVDEDIEIADPVLRSSPVLQDLDLAYILKSKGVTHARAIACRKALSAVLINMLADTKDMQTALNLAKNDGISMTQHAYAILSDMAKEEGALAQPLLKRDDLPQEIAGKLYEFVGEELKAVLKSRFGIGAQAAEHVIDSIVIDMRDPEPAKHAPMDTLMMMAHTQMNRGELKPATLIATLRRGQAATFLSQFAVYFGLSLDTVKAIMRQETGRGLALACRANEITKADFVSLYLLTDKFRNHDKKMVGHNELTRIMVMYDAIDPDEARQIIKNSRH